MTDFRIFDIAGSAMNAQSVRLNTVASNLANADSVAGRAADVYRARMPVFQTQAPDGQPHQAGVEVTEIVESQAPVQQRYQPGHPDANADGYVFVSNVDPVEEMVNMISAARSYQSSTEVLNTSKDLLMRTLNLGR